MRGEVKRLEKSNKYKLIAQHKREAAIERLLTDGAPKSIYKIKEVHDKLTAVKESLRKETSSKAKYEETLSGLEEQES